MSEKDQRVDAYISKSADFAKPILQHVRELVHKACPGIVEDIKWRCPSFLHGGKLIITIAAFKQHCGVNFWNAPLIKGLQEDSTSAGSLGRITSVKDLPSDKILLGYIKEAALLAEMGKTTTSTKPKKRTDDKSPDYLGQALTGNKKASQEFEKFSASKKREYQEWIIEAKTEDTRNRRLATALEWIAEGKTRNWKYEGRA